MGHHFLQLDTHGHWIVARFTTSHTWPVVEAVVDSTSHTNTCTFRFWAPCSSCKICSSSSMNPAQSPWCIALVVLLRHDVVLTCLMSISARAHSVPFASGPTETTYQGAAYAARCTRAGIEVQWRHAFTQLFLLSNATTRHKCDCSPPRNECAWTLCVVCCVLCVVA